MTEWHRPAKQQPETNPWRMEGNLYEQERPVDRPQASQKLGQYGMRGFPGHAGREAPQDIYGHRSFAGTAAEMRQRGLTDEQLAYQSGTPRSPYREQPVERRTRPRGPREDDDPYFDDPLGASRGSGTIG